MQQKQPRSMPPGVAYMDGSFIDIAEARIPILDWGFLRSDATYDVVHVWKGNFFRLADHVDRFLEGLGRLRMELPVDRAELEGILHECVARAGLEDAYVEMICTRGSAPNYERHPRYATPRFMAFAIPFSWILTPERWEEGLHVGVSRDHTRIASTAVDPRVKNYHWLDLVMGWLEVSDRGADTVVLVSEHGDVCEGAGFNIFAVLDGTVLTPDKGVLQGITRRSALDICNDLDIPTKVAPLALEELRRAQEVFVTSTAGGIMPVTRLDDAAVGGGTPGPVTRRLYETYWDRHDNSPWATPVKLSNAAQNRKQTS